MEKKKRAIGYTRVSTDEQAEYGYSLENQRKDIIAYCKKMGYELDEEEIYTDEGKSGGGLKKRYGLKQALSRIKEGDIDYLVVWKVSRLSRRLADVVKIVSELEKYQVAFIADKDSIDTSTPWGKPFLFMASIFAEMERESISVQVKGGMKNKASKGEWNGQAPYGYVLVEGVLEIDSEKAEVVKRIFREYYANNKGYQTIVEGLNTDGYRTNSKTEDGNNAFSVHTVKYILKNPAYAGYVRWGLLEDWGKTDSEEKRKRKYSDEFVYVKGKHTAIIDEEIYDKVQEKIAKNPRAKMKRFQGYHLLSGVLRCPMCGYGMSYQKVKSKGKEYEYYTCNQYANKKTECKPNMINKSDIEEQFFKLLDNIVNNADFRATMENTFKDLGSQIEGVEDRIKRKQKEIKRIETYNKGVMGELLQGDENYKEYARSLIQNGIAEIEEINKSIDKDRREIRELQAKELNFEDVKKVIKNVVKVIDGMDKQRKQETIRSLISKIETEDKQIKRVEFSWGEVLELSEQRGTLP